MQWIKERGLKEFKFPLYAVRILLFYCFLEIQNSETPQQQVSHNLINHMPRDYRDSRPGRDDSYPRSPWFEEREVNRERRYFRTEGPESDYGSDHGGYDHDGYDHDGYDHFESPRYSNYGGPGSGRRRDFSPQAETRTPRFDRYYEDEFNRYTRPHSARPAPDTPGYVSEFPADVQEGEVREDRRRSSRPRSAPRSSRPRAPPRSSRRSLWSRIFHPKSHTPRRHRDHRPRSAPVATLHFGQGSEPFPNGAYRLEDGLVYKMKRRSGSKKHRN